MDINNYSNGERSARIHNSREKLHNNFEDAELPNLHIVLFFFFPKYVQQQNICVQQNQFCVNAFERQLFLNFIGLGIIRQDQSLIST